MKPLQLSLHYGTRLCGMSYTSITQLYIVIVSANPQQAKYYVADTEMENYLEVRVWLAGLEKWRRALSQASGQYIFRAQARESQTDALRAIHN